MINTLFNKLFVFLDVYFKKLLYIILRCFDTVLHKHL